MWHRKIRVFSKAYRLSIEDSSNKGVTNYGLIESETLNGIKFSGPIKRAEKNALRLYVVIFEPFPDAPIKLAIWAYPEDWQKYHLFNWSFVAIRCTVIAIKYHSLHHTYSNAMTGTLFRTCEVRVSNLSH